MTRSLPLAPIPWIALPDTLESHRPLKGPVGRPVAADVSEAAVLLPVPTGTAASNHPPTRQGASESVPSDVDQDDPNVLVRHVNGQPCTNRVGIAYLAGWKAGNSVNVRAKTDPEFPAGIKIGREWWYPFAGDSGVDAYLGILAERAYAKKPPSLKSGDPDELLDSETAADAMHIQWSTFRSYVRYSVPIWEGRRNGRPLIPEPDEVRNEVDEHDIPRTRRYWYRRTLAAHQGQRPGPGTGAGRPAKTIQRG